MKRSRTRRRSVLCACLLVVLPTPAEAFDLDGGVSFGVILAGTEPRAAISPHLGMSWRSEGGFLFTIHHLLSILPAINKQGVGVYDQTSAAIGYVSEKVSFSVGPSLSIYSMPACGVAWCGRIVGLAPGGHAQTSVYFAGPVGVSVNANVDWIGGRSIVLPGAVAAMIVAGPVVRWSER